MSYRVCHINARFTLLPRRTVVLAARVAVVSLGVMVPSALAQSAPEAAAAPSAQPSDKPPAVSFAHPVFLGAIKLYQRVAASRAGICPMWPSCSRFAEEAFATHPPLTAFFLTADRLHRCGHDLARYRPSTENPLKLHDPVPPRSTVLPHAGNRAFRTLIEEWEALSPRLAAHDGFGQTAAARVARLLTASHDERYPSQNTSLGAGDDQDAARQLRFADELRADGEFAKAIVEYQRFLSFYPHAPERGRAILALFGSYRQSGQFEEAARYGRGLIEHLTAPEVLSDGLVLTVGYDWMMLGNSRLARTYFTRVTDSPDSDARQRARLLEGLSYVREGEWAQARSAFSRVSDGGDPQHPLAARARTLAALAAEGDALRMKSPAVAGVLGIVPGLGYLYSGYPGTALSSALVNGLFWVATYKAFQADNTALGITLGLLSVGWYGGNITGSVSTANRRNAAMHDDHVLRFTLGFRY